MSLSDSEGCDAVLISLDDIRDFNNENILPLPAEDLKKIRDWLQPTPYDLERSEFSRHLESYLAGTCQWIISTETYQQWHGGDTNGLLWIKGIPGSGKSVMAGLNHPPTTQRKCVRSLLLFPANYRCKPSTSGGVA
jgi:hypothetical protein